MPPGSRTCTTASFPAPAVYAALNDATMVIVQFESAAALERIEEIVAVDGVDLVLVGLNDLLADWGIPGQYDDPRVRDVYARVIAACRRNGKHGGVGGLATRPDLVAEFVRMGARYVSTGTDLAFLLGACAAEGQAGAGHHAALTPSPPASAPVRARPHLRGSPDKLAQAPFAVSALGP